MPECMDLPDEVEIKQPDIQNVDGDVASKSHHNSEEAYDYEESKQPSVQNQQNQDEIEEDYISDEVQEEYEDDQFD